MTNPLLTWWSAATPEQRRDLAVTVGSTEESLRQTAHAYRTNGRLALTPELARKIDLALDGEVRREEMCPACGRCEYAQQFHR